MNIEEFREYCLTKPGVTEEFPFGKETLVFKVMGKMFALAGLDSFPHTINLKCEPEKALRLREEYPDQISGAYHMNKTHWNSLVLAELDRKLILDLIDHSYDLVVSGLSRKIKQELEKLK